MQYVRTLSQPNNDWKSVCTYAFHQQCLCNNISHCQAKLNTYVGADGCRHVHGMQYLVTVPTVPMAGHLQLVAYQIRMWEQMDAGTSMGCNICSLFQLFRIFNVRSDQESLGQNYNNNQQS